MFLPLVIDIGVMGRKTATVPLIDLVNHLDESQFQETYMSNPLEKYIFSVTLRNEQNSE